MKRIIDGKTYNTKTATKVAEWENGLGYSDFRSCDERLYKTDKGTFFVAGSGGAMTRWSRQNGNGRCGGSGIEVLTEAEALAWCERHEVDAETTEKWFDVEEG